MVDHLIEYATKGRMRPAPHSRDLTCANFRPLVRQFRTHLPPMRLSPTLAVLALARELAASAEGLTLDEMASVVHASRRSAERMRDAVEAAFGALDRIEDGRKVRFRLAARSLGNFAAAPTAEELAELETAARALEAGGNGSRAASLRALRSKIGASLREADRRRLSVDVEAQLRAEAFACAVGPRPFADPAILGLRRDNQDENRPTIRMRIRRRGDIEGRA